jgi:hypothetical protein
METACDRENIVTNVSVIQTIKHNLKHDPNTQS